MSVIIPSYRSERTLPLVLDSLAAQKYTNFETIIVNRGTIDKLSHICLGYKFCRLYRLDVERTAAVNYGVGICRGKFVYYLGSDYLVNGDTLEKAVRLVLRENAEGLTIPNVIDEAQGFWAKVRNLEKRAFEGDDRLEACRFFRKDVFLKLGGYDANLVAFEEHDLHSRLIKGGFKLVRLEEAGEVIIGEPRSLAGYVRKFYYYGTTIGKYIKKQPRESVGRLSPFRFIFAKNRRALGLHPTLTFGFLFFQYCRFFSASAGVIAAKIWSLKEREHSHGAPSQGSNPLSRARREPVLYHLADEIEQHVASL